MTANQKFIQSAKKFSHSEKRMWTEKERMFNELKAFLSTKIHHTIYFSNCEECDPAVAELIRELGFESPFITFVIGEDDARRDAVASIRLNMSTQKVEIETDKNYSICDAEEQLFIEDFYRILNTIVQLERFQTLQKIETLPNIGQPVYWIDPDHCVSSGEYIVTNNYFREFNPTPDTELNKWIVDIINSEGSESQVHIDELRLIDSEKKTPVGKKKVLLTIGLEIEIGENETLEDYARERLSFMVFDYPELGNQRVNETGYYMIQEGDGT